MRRTRTFIVAATLCHAVLAGAGLDRLIVQMPAWRIVGAQGWASYSRHADLGNGLVLYPAAAIGGFVSAVAALIVFRRHVRRGSRAALPIYAAASFAALGLLFTVKAAPFMLSLRSAGDDPVALQRAFDGFDSWGRVRGLVQMLALCANLWSIVAISSDAEGGG